MSIIGIVASERQTNQIRKEIQKEKLKLEIISINYKSIENLKHIKFEIVIIQDSIEKLKEKQKSIKEILANAKYLLLNSDISIHDETFESINVKTLTYGLKQKSTITPSSIGEKQIIISIQRAFKNLNENIIEQQEVLVQIEQNNSEDLYNSLIKICIINICHAKNG